MTLSLYSTYKALRRDAAAETAARPVATGRRAPSRIVPVLTMLGIGLAGIACGDDPQIPDRRGHGT